MEFVFVSFKEDRTVLADGKTGQTNQTLLIVKGHHSFTLDGLKNYHPQKWTPLLNKRQRLVHIKLNLIRRTYAYLCSQYWLTLLAFGFHGCASYPHNPKLDRYDLNKVIAMTNSRSKKQRKPVVILTFREPPGHTSRCFIPMAFWKSCAIRRLFGRQAQHLAE